MDTKNNSQIETEITKAQEEDLDELMEMIVKVYQDMHSRGLMQWGPHYPQKVDFMKDVKKNQLFLLKTKEKKIVGCVALELNDFTSPTIPEHEEVDWVEKRKNKYVILLRLAVHPDYQKQGFAQKILSFAERHAISNNYTAIRLEALNVPLNSYLIEFYKKANYQMRKIVYFANRKQKIYCMFEKILFGEPKL